MAEPEPATSSSSVAAPTGLPRSRSLVGRERELAYLLQTFQERTGGDSPTIVSIEGLAGSGKTSLAAEAVARLAQSSSFPGGGAWIACEGLSGDNGLFDLWGRVARALDLEIVAAESETARRRIALAGALTQRPRTLI